MLGACKGLPRCPGSMQLRLPSDRARPRGLLGTCVRACRCVGAGGGPSTQAQSRRVYDGCAHAGTPCCPTSWGCPRRVVSHFWGGGAPSALPPDRLARWLRGTAVQRGHSAACRLSWTGLGAWYDTACAQVEGKAQNRCHAGRHACAHAVFKRRCMSHAKENAPPSCCRRCLFNGPQGAGPSGSGGTAHGDAGAGAGAGPSTSPQEQQGAASSAAAAVQPEPIPLGADRPFVLFTHEALEAALVAAAGPTRWAHRYTCVAQGLRSMAELCMCGEGGGGRSCLPPKLPCVVHCS